MTTSFIASTIAKASRGLGLKAGVLVGGLVALGLLGASSSASLADDLPGKGIDVKPCTSTSIEGLFHQLIPARALEKLGYKVEMPVTLAVPAMHQAIATGDCTYAVDHWVPLHDSFFDKVKDQTTRLGPVITGAGQGYLIDKKTADAHGITSLDQFKDPAIAKLFDTDGDGKANLVGANPGWGAEAVINHELDAIGLKDTVNHMQGEYSALIADSVARFRRGEPVFFYTWTPNWTVAEMKAGEATVWLKVDPKDCLEKQPCKDSTTGFPLNDIYILANNDFLAQNPAAKKLLSLVKIPLADINAENLLVFQGQDKEADVERHVDDWISKNQATFDGWVNAAKQP